MIARSVSILPRRSRSNGRFGRLGAGGRRASETETFVVSAVTTKDGSEGSPSSAGVTPQGVELRHLRYFVAVGGARSVPPAGAQRFLPAPALDPHVPGSAGV